MKFSDQDMENILKALGNRLRIRIIKFLASHPHSVNYSQIEKDIYDNLEEKPNISHHLANLTDAGIIQKDKNSKYQLTEFGKQSAQGLSIFKEILFKNSAIKVRTSNYTVETFNEEKIEENLVKESGMPGELASEVAQEAKKRLIESKIKYLTTPLIREYVNAILIERGEEKYRHKLTRLGVPPYDIKRNIRTNRYNQPEEIIHDLGKNVFEQFTLLNNISKSYADYILSGQFVLSNIDRYTISPLELVISGKHLIEFLNNYLNAFLKPHKSSGRNNLSTQKKIHKHHKIPKHHNIPKHHKILQQLELDGNDPEILKENILECSFPLFQSILDCFFHILKPFFPQGLTIIRFDIFLEHFLESYSKKNLKIIMEEIFCKKYQDWNIILGISTENNYIYFNPLLELYEESLQKSVEYWSNYPVLQIHLTSRFLNEFLRLKDRGKMKKRQRMIENLTLNHNITLEKLKKYGVPEIQQIYTNLQVPIYFSQEKNIVPSILLEKISINLINIFQEADFDLDFFYRELENALQRVFNYFERKFAVLCHTISHFQNWNFLNKIIFKDGNIFSEDRDSWLIEEANTKKKNYNHPKYHIVCGISYHGLDELIFMVNKLFMKDQPKSRKLAVKILDFMLELISKQNERTAENVKYALAEPSPHKDILTPVKNNLDSFKNHYSTIHNQDYFINGYRLGTHTAKNPISLKSFIEITEDMNESDFIQRSGICILPESMDHSENNNKKYHIELGAFQTLLQLSCSRLSFVNPKLVKDHSYLRYFGKYTTLQKIEEKYGKNSHKQFLHQKIKE